MPDRTNWKFPLFFEWLVGGDLSRVKKPPYLFSITLHLDSEDDYRTGCRNVSPQGPHSHILMTGESDRGSYFIPKKIPQCFWISKFYYLSSGKLKHANFNFGFGQKQHYNLCLCYFWFELMKNTIPPKIPVLFSRPKKIPASFIDPKKSLLAKMSDPKKSFGPPRH